MTGKAFLEPIGCFVESEGLSLIIRRQVAEAPVGMLYCPSASPKPLRTCTKSRLDDQFNQPQRGQWRLFGGPQYDDAAGRQRRCDLPRPSSTAGNPRDDLAHYAERLAHRAGTDIRRRALVAASNS